MRRFTIFFLIFLSMLFNTTIPASAKNVFREGMYQLSDLNPSEDNLYSVQNISSLNDMFVQVYDESRVVQQMLRVPPSTRKFNLVELKANYRIVVIGQGEVYISQY